MNSANRRASTTIALGTIVCIAIGAFPAFAQDEPGTAVIPTVYRDAYTITIKGKPDANGTFTMVFKPHGEDGTEFTVNLVKGMKTKQIAQDLAKELTLAAGNRYKVKQNDKKVVVKKSNKKVPPLAIEMTNQKFTGMSIMIGK
jgi:hypothetical protein